MVRGKGGSKMLTEGERSDIKGQRQEAVATLNEIEKFGKGTAAEAIDKSRVKKEINRYDQILEEGAVPNVRGTTKDKLAKEAKAIEESIQEGMPSRYEMDHPAKCAGAVHKHINWSKKNDPAIRRYKEIQRVLHQGDPTAGDIERLRRER